MNEDIQKVRILQIAKDDFGDWATNQAYTDSDVRIRLFVYDKVLSVYKDNWTKQQDATVITSTRRISKELGKSNSTVYNSLKKFERAGQLYIEQLGKNNGMRITDITRLKVGLSFLRLCSDVKEKRIKEIAEILDEVQYQVKRKYSIDA